MIFSRLSLALSVALLPWFYSPAHAANSAKSTRPKAAATDTHKGAIIMDAATGAVLFEDNSNGISPPASMTKLMTYAVLYDRLQSGALTLSTPVTVTAADSRMGGTQVWLKEKEVFSVEELIYAMMIKSANDAAHALARTAAGSVDAFVALMNAKAQELGMTHSTFRTPHGLPPANRRLSEGDLTSPRDFALLSRYLVIKTDALKYTSIKSRPFGGSQRATLVAMENHNGLLGKIAGVDGLKTGFTNGAGFCLAATAQRNQRRVIVVVMGSSSSKTRDLKVLELIERGFAAIPAESPPFQQSVSDNPLSPVTAPTVSTIPTNVTGQKSAPGSNQAEPPPIKFSVPRSKK